MFPKQELNLAGHFGDALSVGLNAKSRAPVVNLAFFVQFSKQFRILVERPCIIFADSAAQFIQRSIEKDNSGGTSLQEFDIARLGKRAATQGNHGRITVGDGDEERPEGLRLQTAERIFARGLENLGNGFPGTRLDLLIEIDEAPSQKFTQVFSDRGFAGSHEADEEDRSGLVGVRVWCCLRLRH